MTAPELPGVEEIPPYPLFTTATPRPETLALFGCWLAEHRRRADLSTTDLARLADRSSEWIASIEAGLCIPSPAGFQDLKDALCPDQSEASAATPVFDPARIAQVLELDPWGPLAVGLRERYGLRPFTDPTDMATRGDAGGLMALLTEIRHRDRLLTLTPLAGVALLIGVMWAGRPWREPGSFRWPDFDAVTFLGMVAIATTALALPAMTKALDRALVAVRFAKLRTDYNASTEIRADEQTPLGVEHGWYRPGESPYLVPALRDRLTALTREADLSERFLAVFVIAEVFTVWAVVQATRAGASFADLYPWLIACAGGAVLIARTLWRLLDVALAIADGLNDAYGSPGSVESGEGESGEAASDDASTDDGAPPAD